MILTSEVVSRVTHWWQQTMKDVVIVRADFFEKFVIYICTQLRKRKKVGGRERRFEDFLRNESILCWSSLFANPDQAGDAYDSLDIIIELNIVWMD